MKNTNRIYLTGIVFLLLGQLTLCMDVPRPTSQKEVSDPTLHISIALVNAELQNAVYMEKPDAVESLLKISANPNARSDCQWTPLHFAAITGNNLITKKLLQYRAEVNARTTRNTTPLEFAMSFKNTEVIKILLEAKAAPSVPNPDEPTPLEYIKLNRDSKRRGSEERKSRGRK